MKLTLGDKTYVSDLRPLKEPSIGEARAIKRATGLTIAGWNEGLENLGQLDPDVLAGLVFLLRRRAGETVDWAEIDAVPLADLAAGLSFELTDGDIAEMHGTGVAVPAVTQPEVASADAEPEPATDAE